MKHPNESHQENRLDCAVLSVLSEETPPMDPQLDSQIAEQARLETESEFNSETHKWRFPMRQLSKAAIAAAAVILVVLGGFSLLPRGFDSHEAIAKAIEQVRAIRTLSFMTTTDIPGQDVTVTVKTYVHDSGRMRQEISEPAEAINIIDFKQGQILSLVHQAKLAQIIDISGMPEEQMPKDMVQEFSQIDPDHTTYLRDEDRNGVKTHVYQMDQGPISGTVWIDAKTRLPVAMEVQMPAIEGREQPKIIFDRFDWDVQIDPALFSLEIPEGYETKTVDMSNPTEDDWVMMLRIWAALTQGPFPDEMDPSNLNTISQLLHDPTLTPQENFDRMRENLGPVLGEDAFTRDNAVPLLTEISEKLGRGAMFVVHLEQTEWAWVGGGVSAGEADKPLCWWKDKDTGTYRMVYGDFTVREVEPNDLPDRP